MSNKKRVLVVEDNPTEFEELEKELKNSGFEVFMARNSVEARQQASKHWADLDVAVLDNELNDPYDPGITGAGIAIEFRHETPFPPESIIFSAKDNLDYYRLALQLGAAAYLDKREMRSNFRPLIDHVSVLALRRAINPANPELLARIAQIAARSKNESDAIRTFCRSVLAKEIKSCLNRSFLLLLTQDGDTQNCAYDPELLQTSPIYSALQDFAHGNLTEPQVLEKGKLGSPSDATMAALYNTMDQTVFLPLSSTPDMRLSIGLLKNKTEPQRHPRGSENLCRILAQYFRPTVLASIGIIRMQFAELHATRMSIVKLCLAVGQDITYGLSTIDKKQARDLELLSDLADDLNETGQYLDLLDNPEEEIKSIPLQETIETAWDSVAPFGDDSMIERPRVRGGCEVRARKSDLELIFSRLFQWFVYRAKTVPLNVKPAIKINCESNDDGVKITFEDNSHRLPKTLREDLFAPFTQAIPTPFAAIGDQRKATKTVGRKSAKGSLAPGRYLPLYLAKFLVESRYRGLLGDRSDEITEHSYGHRILMQFPLNRLE
jgi:DNA-binding response OmpR family regulator